MENNILIIHGGGPTAVINGSLYGAILEAKKYSNLTHIYGARNGTMGVLKEDFIELEDISTTTLGRLLHTPGSAIGTSRDEIEQDDYENMAEILIKRNINSVLFNGGNGTMDTCGKLYQVCKNKGYKINFMGIPKTIDNDISITDHSPGFASAARYIAQSVREICMDVNSLPIHVVIVETQGRNAGWITAASALAETEDGIGPDLIYLPERAFDQEQFIEDVKKRLESKKGLVVVASEGLKDKDGLPIVEPVFRTERGVYFGDVGSHLANLVIKKLGYKARSEKPGLLGRTSIGLQSGIDLEEAILAGQLACKAVMEGESGKMVAFKRISLEPYKVEPFLVDIEKVMLDERVLPNHYINEEGNGVTEAFKEWCRPLIGEPLKEMVQFNQM